MGEKGIREGPSGQSTRAADADGVKTISDLAGYTFRCIAADTAGISSSHGIESSCRTVFSIECQGTNVARPGDSAQIMSLKSALAESQKARADLQAELSRAEEPKTNYPSKMRSLQEFCRCTRNA